MCLALILGLLCISLKQSMDETKWINILETKHLFFCFVEIAVWKKWVTRDISLHYGGSWQEKLLDNGKSFSYSGGITWDIPDVHGDCLSYLTLVDIGQTCFPETENKLVNIYYIVDNVKLGIDCDEDLQFQWKNIPPGDDGVTHYYFDVLPQSKQPSSTPSSTPFKVDMGTQKSSILNLDDSPSKTMKTPSKTSRTPSKKGKEPLGTQNSCVVNLDSPARNTRSASRMLNSPAMNTRSASKLTPSKSGNHQIPSKTNKLPVKRKHDFTSTPG